MNDTFHWSTSFLTLFIKKPSLIMTVFVKIRLHCMPTIIYYVIISIDFFVTSILYHYFHVSTHCWVFFETTGCWSVVGRWSKETCLMVIISCMLLLSAHYITGNVDCWTLFVIINIYCVDQSWSPIMEQIKWHEFNSKYGLGLHWYYWWLIWYLVCLSSKGPTH